MKILLIFFYLVHRVVRRLRCESSGESIFRDWKGGVLSGRAMDTLLRDEGDLVCSQIACHHFRRGKF